VKCGKRTAKYVEEWNPTQDADASQPQVAMLINSLELRAAHFTFVTLLLRATGFTLREVNLPALKAAARAAGAGTGRVCANVRVWVLRGLYCLQTTTKNSGHDASEFVEKYVFVDYLKFFCKIEGKFCEEKKTYSFLVPVHLHQGFFSNVCPHPCWKTRTVHFAHV